MICAVEVHVTFRLNKAQVEVMQISFHINGAAPNIGRKLSSNQ